MKYENFEQIKGLMDQIASLEFKLKIVEGSEEVQIINDTYASYSLSRLEGDYCIQAQELLGFLENDIKMKIANLKEILLGL